MSQIREGLAGIFGGIAVCIAAAAFAGVIVITLPFVAAAALLMPDKSNKSSAVERVKFWVNDWICSFRIP